MFCFARFGFSSFLIRPNRPVIVTGSAHFFFTYIALFMRLFLQLLFQWMQPLVRFVTGLFATRLFPVSLVRWHQLLARPLVARQRGYLAFFVLAVWLGGSGVSWGQVTIVSNPGGGNPYTTIQAAVNAASNGDIINVAVGTYNEQVLVNKSVTITGVGSPTVNFAGTVTGKPTLFDISVDGVKVQGIHFVVDLAKLKSAIIASGAGIDNVSITDNIVDAYGTPAGSFGDRNAISINYGGNPTNYRVATGGVNSISATGNIINGTLPSSFSRAGIAVDEAGGFFDKNTIQTISQDIHIRFGSNGAITVTNNTFAGGGLELAEQNAGAGTLTVANNMYNGSAGSTYTSSLRLKNNYTARPTTVSGNTFTGHNQGISLENYQNVTLDNNTFTPATGSTTYRHVTVNTKEFSSISGFYVPVLSLTMTNNTFNGSTATSSGTAVAFYNQDNDSPTFGVFVLGTAGNENNFNSNLGNFITLDNGSGTVNPNATTAAPWATNLDAVNNKFDVGTGFKLPQTMTAAERTSLEAKLLHKPDVAALGLITFFYPVKNVTQNTFYSAIQPAIDAATDNDVIELADFTFPESVTVTKPLTLTGVSKTNTILDGTGLTPQPAAPGNNSGFLIANGVTNVTIRNLTVQNFAGSSPNASAGIFAIGGNNNLVVTDIQSLSNVGGVGFYANGPVQSVTVNSSTFSGHTGGARGIVIWNGFKQDIYITNNTVSNNNCCGIELQDGTASGVTIANNTVVNNGDNGIGVTGLKSGAGPNLIANNIIENNGRFGIEIKLPNGTGSVSGDGSIVVENNTVSRTNPIGSEARDLAGIAVFRRAFLLGNNNVDVPTGVVVRNNTVDGYKQLNPVKTESEGFGIVIEGTNHTVTGNTVTNNDIGIQQQGSPTLVLSTSALCAGAPFSLTVSGCSTYDIYVTGENVGGAGINSATATATVAGSAVFGSLTATAGSKIYSASCVEPNDGTLPVVSSAASVTTLTVNAQPVIQSFSPNSVTYCTSGPVNSTLNLTANVTGGTNYTLIGPGGAGGLGGAGNTVWTTIGTGATATAFASGTSLSSPSSITVNRQLSTARDGTYTLIVTNTAGGCSAMSTTVVSTSTSPNANATPTSVSFACTSSPVTLTAAPATNVSYQWFIVNPTGAASLTLLGETTRNYVPSTVGAYRYLVRVTSTLSGCVDDSPLRSYTLSQSPSLGTPVATSVACFGGATGAIAIVATGGTAPFAYTLSGSGSINSTGSFTGLTASNSYSVSVKNAEGCLAVAGPISVTQPTELPTISSLASTSINCTGNTTGSFTVVATGTAPFTFSANGQTNSDGIFTGLTAGTYPISLTDANGCSPSSVTSVTINQPASAPVISSLAVTNVLCNGGTGSLTVVATGGTGTLNYTLTPDGTTNASGIFAGLSVGSYTVTVGDANGCQVATGTLSVTQPAAALAISNVVASSVSCSGASTGAVSVTATGGTAPYTFVLANGSSSTLMGATVNFTGKSTGIYAITLTDANGCSATQTNISITQSSALSLAAVVSQTIGCAGGNNGIISVTASGGTGSYTITAGGNYSTTVASSGGVSSITGLPAGSYSATVTDANGCFTVLAGIVVAEPSVFAVTLTPSATAVCLGTTVSLTATVTGGTGAYSYTWTGGTTPTNGSVVSAVNTPGTRSYTVAVSDANGCTATQTASVTVNTFPVVTLSGLPSTTLSCAQPNVTLQAGGGGTYAFAGPGLNQANSAVSTAVVSQPGEFSVTVTTNGCSSTTSIVISQNNVISSVSMGNPAASSVVCVGGSVSVPVGVTNATGLQWYKDGVAVPGQTSATLTLGGIQSSQAGNYRLVATGACNSLTTIPGFTLTVNPEPTVTLVFNNSTTVMGTGIPTITIPAGLGQNFQVLGGTSFVRTIIVDRINGYEIRQVDQNATGIFPVTRPGPFTIVVTNSNGCSRTVQGVIVVAP